jgi:hypothetical protein
MLDRRHASRQDSYNLDYCIVLTEFERRYYWEELGLACVTLPADIGAWGEFFGGMGPQPGPPFVPYSDIDRAL